MNNNTLFNKTTTLLLLILIQVFIINKTATSADTIRNYANNSVLAQGKWYKIHIKESGIYKVTYNDLLFMGVKVENINPDKIRVYGNGGMQLPVKVDTGYIDDLQEIPIQMFLSKPGKFGKKDYFIFYGKGVNNWFHNKTNNLIEHSTHIYAEKTSYFITIGTDNGRRIKNSESQYDSFNYETNEFTDCYLYENDVVNIFNSGSKWFDMPILKNGSKDINIESPFERIENEDIKLSINSVAYSYLVSSAQITVNNNNALDLPFQATTHESVHGVQIGKNTILKVGGQKIKIKIKYNSNDANSKFWIDYLALNIQRKLHFNEGQLIFRNIKSIDTGRITKFSFNCNSQNARIWRVTNPINVCEKSLTLLHIDNATLLSFIENTDKYEEFIIFDNKSYKSVEINGAISNQNLHGIRNVDMVIVTHPEFEAQANRLAHLHNKHDNISANVVLVQQIYNEFSSGTQDAAAIRDFMKMIYDRDKEKQKYLLLFGGTSFDPKNRVKKNTYFVPSFETSDPVEEAYSFVSDDYFGLLNYNEAQYYALSGFIDVGIGRLPVLDQTQAENIVDKIEKYIKNDSITFGDWKNNMLLIADDKDGYSSYFEYLIGSEDFEKTYLRYSSPYLTVDKVYCDSYKPVAFTGGIRYPEAREDIINKFQKGQLFINYSGHGGVKGWAHERILEISDIKEFTNANRMGLVIASTCEFSRHDNPEVFSAAEEMFLNPKGGALHLLTTSRVSIFSNNKSFVNYTIEKLFEIKNGNYPRIGDAYKYAKNKFAHANVNIRNIHLFGDPALRLPYPNPNHNVVIDSIINNLNNKKVDTLSANAFYTLYGSVNNADGSKFNDFNGWVSIKLFDKATIGKTVEGYNSPQPYFFKTFNNVIYQGKASVRDGKFTAIIPISLDINYKVDLGRISLYASNKITDAAGFNNKYYIGGVIDHDYSDNHGPEIDLYMNTKSFNNGDLLNESPRILAFLRDESGINTVNSIGHGLVAIIDDNPYNTIALNDYYNADIDTYKKGSISFKINNISNGEHKLTLKAWDVFNNSSEKSINFVIDDKMRFNIQKFTAYPNPSSEMVNFTIDHNIFEGDFTCEIEIFNTLGVMVNKIPSFTITSNGYKMEGVHWNSTDFTGKKVNTGLYLCKLKLTDRNGLVTPYTSKVIIIN